MSDKQLHKLGIDIGSTTVKIAILDSQDNILFSDYERHFANIQETLADLLEKAHALPKHPTNWGIFLFLLLLPDQAD